MWNDLKNVLKIYQGIYSKYFSFLMKPLLMIAVFFLIVKLLSLFFHYTEGYIIVLFKILLPFLIGYLIAFMLEPLNQFLIIKCKIPRKIVAPTTLFGTITISFVVISYLIYHLGHQVIKMGNSMILYFKELNYIKISKDIQEYVVSSPFSSYFTEDKIELYLNKIQDNLSTILKYVTDFLTHTGGNVTVFTSNLLVNVIPSILIIIFISLLTTFFITKDYDKIKNNMEKFLPNETYQALIRLKQEVSKNIINYFKGQLGLVSISGLIFFIAFLVLESPYALLLALICMVLDIVPIIGTIVFIIPYVIYSMIHGDMFSVYVLGIAYVVAVVVRQIIEPKIMGSSLGIHPILIIVAMYVGALTLGGLGVVLGPFILISVKILVDADIIDNPLHFMKKK